MEFKNETERYNYVMKELNLRYGELKRIIPNSIVAVFHFGSFNYGVEITEGEYESDIDIEAFVIPTLEQLIKGERVSQEIIMASPDYYLIKIRDIRDIVPLLKKANPVNYETLLYTKFCLINPEYEYLIKYIRENKFDLLYEVCQNKRWFNAILGTIKSKEKALLSYKEGDKYSFRKTAIQNDGYYGKALVDLIRMYYLAYHSYFLSTGMWKDDLYTIKNCKDFLVMVKKQQFNLDTILIYKDLYNQKIEELYKEINEYPKENRDVAKDIYNNIDELVKNIIIENVKEKL